MNMNVEPFVFEIPLVEGVIEKRKSQFTMMVTVDGTSTACHCPTTGRIGNLDVAGRPCLLSKSTDPNRKTPYTVEAVSLNRPEDSDKRWIGINQNAANRYVEHYLRNGGFAEIVHDGSRFISVSEHKPRINYGISQSDMYQMYAYSRKYSTPEIWLLYPMNTEMGNHAEISFESADGVNVRLFFVDVANIERSLQGLRERLIG